jgi:calcineurin-like phosphoesterase family protein
MAWHWKEIKMDYFAADYHFYHKQIRQYENRPFGSDHEMHEQIIKRHNSKVRKNDRLVVAGDFSFAGKEKTAEILTRMNGTKILVKGNHDRNHSAKWFTEAGFDFVYDYPFLYRGFFIISHEPVYVNENMPYANIHGHLHKTDWTSKRFLNVGIDNHDFYPVSFDDVMSYFCLTDEPEDFWNK